MSFHTMAFLGMAPFGSLMGGGLALPLLRRRTRPLHIDLGIIRDVRTGLQ